MDRIFEVLLVTGIEFLLFISLVFIGMFVFDKLKNSHNRLFNPKEYLPEDELHTLRQVSYLIMMSFSFINILYSFFINIELIYFSIFDVILSLFIAITLDKSSLKNKILLVLLFPLGSLFYLYFGRWDVIVFNIIHVFVFLYFVKYYYDKFRQYTESNGLGIAIILLFSIIFVSFFITQFVEKRNPLDSLVMVSNAFTSNGYTVLGNSITGKINSIFLVWGGYIISGVATSTLTATILLKHFNRRFKELEKLIEEE